MLKPSWVYSETEGLDIKCCGLWSTYFGGELPKDESELDSSENP